MQNAKCRVPNGVQNRNDTIIEEECSNTNDSHSNSIMTTLNNHKHKPLCRHLDILLSSMSLMVESVKYKNEILEKVNSYVESSRKHFLNKDIECYNVPKFEDNFYENLKNLLDMFMKKYKAEGSNWLEESIIDLNYLDLYTAKNELSILLNSIFSEFISWGRIISMLSYVTQLSLAAIKNGLYQHLNIYIYVTINYIDSKLWEWIKSNGGWNGIENFANGNDNAVINDILTSFTKVARITALALAGVAICRFVIDKI